MPADQGTDALADGRVAFEVTDAPGTYSFLYSARNATGSTSQGRIVLKTVFTGTLNLSEAAALEALLEQQAEVFASLNAWERHTDLVVVPDEHEFEDLDVGGYAADAVAELRATAASEAAEAPAAGDALRLLYRLVGGAAR